MDPLVVSVTMEPWIQGINARLHVKQLAILLIA